MRPEPYQSPKGSAIASRIRALAPAREPLTLRAMTKTASVAVLVAAEIAAMSLWFVSAAVLPDMAAEADLGPARGAALSSAVQAGFVFGAVVSAVLGIADRFDPRRVFALSAFGAAAVNGLLVMLPIGGDSAIAMRFATGALLAGVYPVGMKIAVGWGTADRGFLVGLLVGGLTLGSAAPHLLAFLGGADWRTTVLVASVASAGAGVAGLAIGLGPHHAKSPRFDPKATLLAWTDIRLRRAILGYLGHMWELYAMWAWIGVATAASYALTMPEDEAVRFAKLTAFAAVAVGGVACWSGGWLADRMGKAEFAIWAMAISGSAAIATALSFGAAPWITLICVLVWGASIIPDSAQFSALVADNSPPQAAGSLMTLQTALGFALTIATVQATPWLAETLGWPIVLAAMALGPAFGIWAMWGLRRPTG